MRGRRNELRVGRGRALAVAVLLLAAACTSAPEGTDTTISPPTESSDPTFSLTVHDGAVFLDLRTGEQTPLPSTGAKKFGAAVDDGHYYAASPDGSWVIYEDTCCSVLDVAALASIDGARGRRLDPEGPINYYAGGWSPDGTKIVYQRLDQSTTEVGELYVQDIASGRTTRITDVPLESAGSFYLAPIFSQNGRQVIFQLPRGPSINKWDLWSVPVTGGEATLLVKNAAQPVAFGGPIDVFVRPMPDSFDGSRLVIATPDGFRPIVEALSGIFEPKMSPDGSRIAYADAGSIHVVDVSTEESTQVAVGRMAAWLDDDTLIVAPET